MNRRLVSVVVAVVFAAVLIAFLVYTHRMEATLRRDAEVFSRVYASAFLGATAEEQERTNRALFEITEQARRLQIPIVLTDLRGNPTSAANLPFGEFDRNDSVSVRRTRRYVRQLDIRNEPFRAPEFNLAIHFGEPRFLRQLRWVPWLTAAVLLVAVGGGGWLIYTSFQGERERIWSAMARESAHQMGTPLSSLVGWLEQMEGRAGVAPPESDEAGAVEGELIDEMKTDVERLLKVSRRFELIGRSPSLEAVRVDDVLHRLEDYFSVRLPTLGRAVEFLIDVPPDSPAIRGNATLLEWAFENLVKNSLDALAGRRGQIAIAFVETRADRAVYRVSDSGPGVDPSVRKRLFEIGVTTKERGWGVGLSLTRRILEDMHDGSIELEPSAVGATFRVELPVADDEESAA